MDSITSFLEYFRSTLDEKNQSISIDEKISKDFFVDFIEYTPAVIMDLRKYISDDQFNLFYQRLNDLKYLCVFDEELNKYWFAMRGLSGALLKLTEKKNLKNARAIYNYYFGKYGDRRALQNENWLENKRWLFLDSLADVNNMEELDILIEENRIILKYYLNNYHFHLIRFIEEVRKKLSLE